MNLQDSVGLRPLASLVGTIAASLAEQLGQELCVLEQVAVAEQRCSI